MSTINTMKQLLMSQLRNKKTSRSHFRYTAQRIAHVLAHEAAQHLAVQEIQIQTPLDTTTGIQTADPIVLIPILRSGITLLPVFLQYFPDATVGVVGLQRDEKTAQAHWYYENLPPLNGTQQCIILDPMIATGGTGLETLNKLKQHGMTQDKMLFVSIVCAPEGLAVIRAEFPDITIITAAIDDHLNKEKFIVPGLGDFGDRYFGTE